MNSAIERLLGLQVQHVMARDLATVTANSTMAEAADTLRDYKVTGVPVVDEMGRCVGILSATDFVLSKAEDNQDQDLSGAAHVLSSGTSSGTYQVEEVVHDLVKRHMSPCVQTINENCTLIQAGRCMCEGHIHRLVVVDRQNRPIGIVSSLDLVSSMIHAIEE